MGRQPAGRSGTEEELKARAEAWAERWCRAQEVPFTITDRQVLAQIAELMGLAVQSRNTGRRRDSSKRL
jgi:hypothetical protein